MKSVNFLFLLSVILVSCDSSKKQQIYHFDKEIQLIHEKEVTLSESFINLFHIYVTDSILILKCDDPDKDKIHLFNIETGGKITSFLKQGRGPNEVLSVKDLLFNSTTNQLDVYDDANSEVLRFSLDSVLKYINTPLSKTKVSYNNYFAIPVSDSVTVGQGTDVNAILGVYKQDSLIQPFLEYPDKKLFVAKTLAYQGFIRANNTFGKFAYASTKCDLLSIFTIDNNRATIDTVLYSYLPEYEDDSHGNIASIKLIDDVPYGFFAMSITDEYIYALYVGRTRKSHPENFFQGNQIYVLDWKGNCVSKIILDKDIRSFCVDKNNQFIYAIEINYQKEEPDAKIYQYKIDDGLI